MPITYSLKEDGAFVYLRAEGKCTSADVMAFLRELGEDPRLQDDHVTLFDVTRVSIDDLNLEDFSFQKAVSLERDHPDKLIARKLAIVVGDPKVRIYAMRYEDTASSIGESTKIFNNLMDAKLWLKL